MKRISTSMLPAICFLLCMAQPQPATAQNPPSLVNIVLDQDSVVYKVETRRNSTVEQVTFFDSTGKMITHAPFPDSLPGTKQERGRLRIKVENAIVHEARPSGEYPDSMHMQIAVRIGADSSISLPRILRSSFPAWISAERFFPGAPQKLAPALHQGRPVMSDMVFDINLYFIKPVIKEKAPLRKRKRKRKGIKQQR